MKSPSFLNSLINQPKKLFLLDAGGALLSAVMLGLVLPAFQSWVGMPLSILYLLSTVPVVFMAYDLFVYYKVDLKVRIFLKLIAQLNIVYCLLSIILMYTHWMDLTTLGKLYFLGECSIIIAIAYIEWKVAANL